MVMRTQCDRCNNLLPYDENMPSSNIPSHLDLFNRKTSIVPCKRWELCDSCIEVVEQSINKLMTSGESTIFVRCSSNCGTMGQCALYDGHLNDTNPGQLRHMNTRGDTWAVGNEHDH